MTVNELKNKLRGEIVVDSGQPTDGVYVGDFLSRVMGKAPSGCAWLTVMNNVNVAGVATLAEISAVVLCEGVMPDTLLTEKCRAENISLITSPLGVFEACVRLGK